VASQKTPPASSNGAPKGSALPAIDPVADRAKYPNFVNGVGAEMLLVPSTIFQMGSDDDEAAPNEQPVTQVTLSRYYFSRHPVTNAQYEMFDPGHARKRMPGAGDQHPAVYVNSAEAIRFCEWLSAREKRRYRLPTEAEWEYAARGPDGRKYPWGDAGKRGDLANFADRNTLLPGAIARSTMGLPKLLRWAHFRAERARSGSKTWRGMSGNGASTSSNRIVARPRPIPGARNRGRNESIAGGAGNRGSTACGRQRAARTFPIIRATTLVSGSCANADESVNR
jgi:hypothetical protein